MVKLQKEKDMERIELLPKWYGKEEKNDRTNKMKKTVKELLSSDILPEKAKEKIKNIECNMYMIADTYSRNYEIKALNTYIDWYNTLTK